MKIALRTLQWLALSVWVGGVIFFAFVLAPVAFSGMVTSRTGSFVVSGAIVGQALRELHWIGLVCGVVFALMALLQRRMRLASLVLVAAMLLATAYSQFSIIPRMEHDRVSVGGDIDAAPANNPERIEFERLHPLSEKIEGAVLFCGLALIAVTAAAHTIE